MNENPLVTVNILSYNRKNELRNTLHKVYEQDYKNIEVIVVDNASTDGSPQMVENEFPGVKLIKLDENIGIAGWNRGFEVAKGNYVLVLDDDAYPDRFSISIAMNYLSSDDRTACIAFNIIDLNENNYASNHWQPQKTEIEFSWPIFVGCAVLFDLTKINDLRMPNNYFIYQHELPIAATIYKLNFRIAFLKEVRAFHFFKNQSSYSQKLDFYIMRNNLNFILSELPLIVVPFYFCQNCLFFLLRSIRRKWVREYFSVLKRTQVNKMRNRIDLKYFLNLRRLHLFNLPLFSKIKKL